MDLQDTAQLLGNFGEFFGSLAILITLVYLSVQVRSAQSASIAESISTLQASSLDLQRLLIENGELLVKAEAGSELSLEEVLTFQNLVQCVAQFHFLAWLRNKTLSSSSSRPPDAHCYSLANFLHQYPAARQEWERAEKSRIATQAIVGMATDFNPGWSSTVEEFIAKLDASHSERRNS